MMTKELKQFILQCAKTHSPFVRKTDNQYYQKKYFEIFKFIFNAVPDLDSSVNIEHEAFEKIYRNYKQVLIDLYNDHLIYFMMNKTLIHGNKMMAKFIEKSCGHFTAFYRIDSLFSEQIKVNCFTVDIRTNNKYKNKLNNKFNTVYKEINDTPNFTTASESIIKVEKITNPSISTTNESYNLLKINGEQLLKDLPHFGRYTDGRIYSMFHTLPREIREVITLGDRGYIKEVFDISHCYPTLIGILIKGVLDDEIVTAYQTYIMNNDIYSDTLRFAGIEVTKENRNRIKPYFNKFILSTIKDNKRNLKWRSKDNDPVLFNAVINYVQAKFPEVFNFIWNFNTTTIKTDNKTKTVKTIAHELQREEKKIVDNLVQLIPNNIPYVTLHDAIYIGENDLEAVSDINFEDQFRKAINF